MTRIKTTSNKLPWDYYSNHFGISENMRLALPTATHLDRLLPFSEPIFSILFGD